MGDRWPGIYTGPFSGCKAARSAAAGWGPPAAKACGLHPAALPAGMLRGFDAFGSRHRWLRTRDRGRIRGAWAVAPHPRCL